MLRIYEGSAGERDLYLRLIDDEEDINLVVCDSRGNPLSNGTLLYIDRATKGVYTCRGIDENLGFCVSGDINRLVVK